MNYTGPSAKPHDSGVAVAIVVARDEKVLLLKRRGGSTGEGTWSIAGGGVEFMEDPLEAATRELREETGLEATDFEFLGYTNDTHAAESLHYVTLTLLANKFSGQPTIAEPHKCSEIGWFSLDELPKPLYEPAAKKLNSEVLRTKIRQLKH